MKREDPKKLWDAKTMRLCRQVEETLSLALAGECGDEVLSDLVVESVVPAPDPSRLLVTVAPGPGAEPRDPLVVLERLGRAKGFFRSEVAAVLHRKKVPDLAFRLLPEVGS